MMKNQKGITLTSLVIYIIITMMGTAILASIMAYFSKDVRDMTSNNIDLVELDKFYSYFLQDVKKTNNEISRITKKIVEFEQGNTYTYQNHAIYLSNENNEIKIADNIQKCKFSIDNSNNKVIITEITINDNKYTRKFVLNTGVNDTAQIEEEDYTKTITKTQYNSNGKTAQIPDGFVVSGIASESSIDNGLVIYYQGDSEEIEWPDPEDPNYEQLYAQLRQDYDQFVWIPIIDEGGYPNPNAMFICQAKTGSNGDCNIILDSNGRPICDTHKALANSNKMAGKLFATATGSINKTLASSSQKYVKDSGVREPDIVTNVTVSLDDMQDEYNNIVKSVIENKGFWVARYESSGLNGTVRTVAGATTAEETNFTSFNWQTWYTNQKTFATEKNCYGGMILGAAYDQVVFLVEGKTRIGGGSYSITATNQAPHNLSGSYATGYIDTTITPYNDMVYNIYDLEGNLREVTTEAYTTNRFMAHGGYYSTARSAGYRTGCQAIVSAGTSTAPSFGSRMALFVK